MTAQKILDIREKYSHCSLGELYDTKTMPKELIYAHRDNDKAVMNAYNLPVIKTTQESCLSKLLSMYKELIEEEKRESTVFKFE